MATDTGSAEGFGRVSRTIGTAFRYLLLAATLLGIVILAILLVFVANDAIQPLTADPGWHLTFFVTLVVPTLAVGASLADLSVERTLEESRRPFAGLSLVRGPRAGRLSVGLTALGLLVIGLMFGAGAAMLFVDVIPALVWLSFVVALALPLVGIVGIERFDDRLPFVVRFVLAAGLLVGSLLVVPGIVQTLPTVPTNATIMAFTLGLPVAALIAWHTTNRFESARTGLLAGGAALAASGLAMVLGPLVGLTPLPAVVLTVFAVVPTGTYAGIVAGERPADRAGLLFPAVVVGGALLGAFVVESMGFAGPQSWVDWQFLTSGSSSTAEEAGLYPAIVGSVLLMLLVTLLSFPLGVGAAVYLEEYAPENRFTRIIDVNISNLAGVPSVVYGLLGLGVFVTYLGQPPGTVIVGGAALALLILPIIIISAREAIRSVPSSMREASYGMGATRWQTVKNVVLPRAFPGILTGTILALGRAIGETAPLIMIGAPNVFDLPTELTSRVGAMPLQIYAWASLFASDDFYTKAVPAGVVVLLAVLLAMNSVAIVLRNRYQRER